MMVLEVSAGLLISIVGLLISCISIIYSYINSATRLEHRLTSLEHKIEPIWEAILQQIPKLLIRDTTPELDGLIKKSMNGLKEMTLKEIRRLVQLLDLEYKQAVLDNDTGRAIGITLMKAGIKGETMV